MPAKTLTEAAIKRLPAAPKGKRAEYLDRLAPGLILRVNDRGSKSWLVRFSLHSKRTANGDYARGKLSLGSWPGVGLKEAREAAREARDSAKAGIDPRRIETDPTEGETMGQLIERYIERETPKMVTGDDRARHLRHWVKPQIGDVLVVDYRRKHHARLRDHLEDNAGPSVPALADKAVKRVLSWGLDRGEIEINPLAGMRVPSKPDPRQRALDDSEIVSLWSVLDQMAYPFGPMVKMLLLTGQRLREVAWATWDEFQIEADGDVKTGLWTIPAARSKSGREHKLPLSQSVIELLDNLPPFTEGNFVFTTTSGRRPVSGFSKCKKRIDTKLTKAETPLADWRLHDLRRSMRSGLARLRVPSEVAERILNHAGDPLVRTYTVHDFQEEMGEALEAWGQHVTRLIDPPPTENVVELAGSRGFREVREK